MQFRLDSLPLDFASPEALRPALDGSSGVEGLWHESDLPGLWRQQMESTLEGEMRSLGQHALAQFDAVRGDVRTLGEGLLGPATSVSLLRLIKQYGSAELANPDALTPRPVAGAMYHLAIARALIDFGETITSLDRSVLHSAWREIEARPWLDASSRAVLHAALKGGQS